MCVLLCVSLLKLLQVVYGKCRLPSKMWVQDLSDGEEDCGVCVCVFVPYVRVCLN